MCISIYIYFYLYSKGYIIDFLPYAITGAKQSLEAISPISKATSWRQQQSNSHLGRADGCEVGEARNRWTITHKDDLELISVSLSLCLDGRVSCRWSWGSVIGLHKLLTQESEKLKKEPAGGVAAGGLTAALHHPEEPTDKQHWVWDAAVSHSCTEMAAVPSPHFKSCLMPLAAQTNPELCREGNSGKCSSSLAKLTWCRYIYFSIFQSLDTDSDLVKKLGNIYSCYWWERTSDLWKSHVTAKAPGNERRVEARPVCCALLTLPLPVETGATPKDYNVPYWHLCRLMHYFSNLTYMTLISKSLGPLNKSGRTR